MKTLNYFEVCTLLNKGAKTTEFEIKVRGRWLSWEEADKILKGIDFTHVEYRRIV